MRRNDLLWFEDVSAVNEPVLSFPVLGRISMRQFFILGVAGMASYGLFSSTHAPASAVPISAGALLALVRPKVATTEWMLYSALLFFGRRLGRMLFTTRPRAPRIPAGNARNREAARIIILADPSRPFRFRTRLVGRSGQPAATRKATVFLDDTKVDSLVTDDNGVLESAIVPGAAGRRMITVYVEGQNEPAFSESIEIRTS